MEQNKAIIRTHIKESTFKEADKITDETLIFQEGFFDSMGFVVLIDFLEGKFGIKINEEDLIEENFESVNAISGYISRKLSST